MAITRSSIKTHGWYIADLEYKLDDLQHRIKRTIDASSDPLVCVLSSRQIGKSYLLLLIAIEYCLLHPGVIVRILAATIKQVADIVQDNMAPLTADAPAGLIERYKSDYRWRIGQSSLRIGSLERSHVDNNRGGNASLIIYEEGGFVNSDDYRYAVQSVIGPQLIRSNGREIHITSPSEDEGHYIHTDIVPRAESLGTLFRYTIYDSPSITESQIAAAAARCGGYESEAWKREYLAEIVRSQTLMVIPEFSEANHVKAFELPEYYKALLSIDLGGIKDKTGSVLVCYDFEHDKLLVVDEFMCPQNTPTGEIVSRARELEASVSWEGTPERFADVPGQVQVDMMNDYNYPIRIPAKDDRDAQINSLRLIFTNMRIIIHPRCANLIGCIKSARYDDKRKDFKRTDAFGHADILMALVYAHRMLDRSTNPFPKRTINRDKQMQIRYRDTKDSLEEIAEALMPYNPMTDRRTY